MPSAVKQQRKIQRLWEATLGSEMRYLKTKENGGLLLDKRGFAYQSEGKGSKKNPAIRFYRCRKKCGVRIHVNTVEMKLVNLGKIAHYHSPDPAIVSEALMRNYIKEKAVSEFTMAPALIYDKACKDLAGKIVTTMRTKKKETYKKIAYRARKKKEKESSSIVNKKPVERCDLKVVL